MPKTVAVLDTNIFLHFKRPDQIDWLKLLNADSVEVLIPPAVMTELERKKTDAGKEWLKQRAKERVRWICDVLDAGGGDAAEIRRNVLMRHELNQVPVDPQFAHVPDEAVRRTMDELKLSGARVVFVADDRGALRLAAQRGFEPLRLGAEFEDPGPSEEKVAKRGPRHEVETAVVLFHEGATIELREAAEPAAALIKVPREMTLQEAQSDARYRRTWFPSSGSPSPKELVEFSRGKRTAALSLQGDIVIKNVGTDTLDDLMLTNFRTEGASFFRAGSGRQRLDDSSVRRGTDEPLHVGQVWRVRFTTLANAEVTPSMLVLRADVVGRQMRPPETHSWALRLSFETLDPQCPPLPEDDD